MPLTSLCTSLGSWDTIEGKRRHGVTFPLAIVGATMEDAGFPPPRSWEGDAEDEGPGTGRNYDLLLISTMDSRHFWSVAPWLRHMGIPDYAKDRAESDPIVIVGGQAATAPAPIEAFVDVVYVGEAEAHLGDLLRCLRDGRRAGWSRSRILESAAAIPGCLVPSHYPAGHVIQQVYADDISITLSERLWVNHRKIHRIEIARGCQSKCGFCALGWRSKYRENDAAAVSAALAKTAAMGVREVHLSAGDAEAHSGIAQLRQAVRDNDMRDYGWTGRMDTVNDCSVAAGKMFAFGLEGMSHRLRSALGKPRLSDDYITDKMREYWSLGGRRAMWHMIGGVPGTTAQDAADYRELLDRVASEAGGHPETLYLEIGRQPFGPLPHTPMQWLPPGLSSGDVGAVLADFGHASLVIKEKTGQPVHQALLNTLVMRGGREVTPLVAQGTPRLSHGELAARAGYAKLCRRWKLDASHYLGHWSPDEPTPWAHVQSAYEVPSLIRAYRRICDRLSLDSR